MKTKALWGLLIVILLLAGLYIAGSTYFSNILINRETQSLADGLAYLDPSLAELGLNEGESVSIAAGDVTLAGLFFDNPHDGNCAVLLLHGYTGTRYGALPYAPLFWERGCDLLAYDARGHGESSDAYHTYGYHEKQDGLAAYQWLRDHTGLAPEKVGLTGVSYGAATSLQMLPLITDAAFVLADSPYQDLESIVSYQAGEQFGSWVNFFVPGALLISELRADFDKDDVSPRNAIADTDTPVFIIHAKEDTFTPASHSEAIYANSNPQTTWLEITDWGAPHGGSFFYEPEAYKLMVDEFLTIYAPDFGIENGR